MPRDAELKRLAKGVAKDIAARKVSDRTLAAREYLETRPGAALTILDLLQVEVNRKTPNRTLIEAYLHLFSQALEFARYGTDRGYDWAEELIEACRALIISHTCDGKLPDALLMPVMNCFQSAGLDPGDELRSLITLLADKHADQVQEEFNPADLEAALVQMADELGNSVFDLFECIAELTQNLPAELRVYFATIGAASQSEALRDATALYLLDGAPEVRAQLITELGRAAGQGLVSPVTLRRMITLRNWIPEGERPALDRAIKTARKSGQSPAPWDAPQISQVFASSIDGSGAQSVFAIIKQGRKHAVASLLVKQGIGIGEAWCMRKQSTEDVNELMDHVASAIVVLPISLAFVELLVRHNISVSLQNGRPLPAGLLDFVEVLGLSACQPADCSTESLLAQLEQEAEPSWLSEESVCRVLEVSAELLQASDIGESWYEEDSEVQALIDANAKATDKIDLIFKSILEPRRAKWADRFLWMALWAKHEEGRTGPWQAFLILARAIHEGRPLTQIPIMRLVAEETLDAVGA